MEIGIIGLPQSGKTTVFNALTAGKAQTAAHGGGGDKPNLGVAKVMDPRIDILTRMFKPKKTVYAEVKYIDLPGAPPGLGKSEGIAGQYLNHMAKTDALLHVVRAFKNESVPHVQVTVDYDRDISSMNMELAFADMAIMERRLERIDASAKSAKPTEREAAQREKVVIARIKADLEKDIPVREQQISDDERRTLENYAFLTSKPLLLGVNIGEESLSEADKMEESLAKRYGAPNCKAVTLCGKLEAELAQLSDAEAEEFRKSMNLKESSLNRMIRLSHELLGLIPFFTVGPDEVRAWMVRKGSLAPKAAGKIHTDIERGFIRAEVISYKDMIDCSTLAEARKRGLLRLEGKSYVVQDGDIINFLHNE